MTDDGPLDWVTPASSESARTLGYCEFSWERSEWRFDYECPLCGPVGLTNGGRLPPHVPDPAPATLWMSARAGGVLNALAFRTRTVGLMVVRPFEQPRDEWQVVHTITSSSLHQSHQPLRVCLYLASLFGVADWVNNWMALRDDPRTWSLVCLRVQAQMALDTADGDQEEAQRISQQQRWN